MSARAIASANKGGTALPTCRYCDVLGPKNRNESWNDWRRAFSRTVGTR